MYTFTLPATGELAARHATGVPTWLLLYATEEVPRQATLRRLKYLFPETPIFGATSFRGVFSPEGFHRGAAVLAGEAVDGLQVATAGAPCGPTDARVRARQACEQLARGLGRPPGVLLLHATPGFEERLLAGIADAFGGAVPVYGGSAADDDVAGRWAVFHETSEFQQGFVLAGFGSARQVRGSFLAGYLPTGHGGRVTRAEGRKVLEIDGEPAAHVYNRWSDGLIARELSGGGSVLAATTLSPLGRVVGETMGMPRRLISHPHAVEPGTGALTCFSEFQSGDEVDLMTCSREQLLSRMGSTVQRALGPGARPAQGGVFAYCGGSLNAVLEQAPRIAADYQQASGGGPFIGAATFGEQGWFFDRRERRHGNLMCSAILF